MDRNSEIIRTEIIRILNENGKTRGADLAKRVIAKVGNEKTVYREISALVEAGEIDRKVHDRSHIEYELIDLDKSANSQLRDLHKEVEVVLGEILKFDDLTKEEKISLNQRLRSVIHFIQVVQSTDGIMKLLAFYPAFKKDRMYSQINRKIDDCWHAIMGIISHQTEEAFLNRVLANLRVNQQDAENFN